MSKSHDSGETTTYQSGPHAMPDLVDEHATLPVIDLSVGSAEFELGETLGEGGMGKVVSAKQKALQRSVAIKFIKGEGGDATVLLREAITTGRLEHPNIVPVHVLAQTAAGAPFFSMKRVEGTPWSDALKGKRSLVDHLEILQRVCDAVAFAHSQGVIHRDLKPANVMIGSFGEAYLVDWGLAASMRRDSVLPLASEAGVAGTPAYLAPESAVGGKLGPWTDVFLLGATLYDLLMGRPPYSAPTIAGTFALAAEANEPLFDAMVPTELANICRRAMQRDPAARFESAKAFRDAITDYLHHREAFELHERTMTKLVELERAAGGAASAVPIERLFTECRFGFEQVRQAWPDFDPARAALRRAQVLMVRHELARNAVQSARAILSEMLQPPAELVLLVEDAERAEQAKAARLIALEKQAKDLSTDSARDSKADYLLGLAAVSALASAALQLLESTGKIHIVTRDGLIFSVLLLLNSILYSTWLLRQSEVNQLQRRMGAALVGLSVLSGLGWLMAFREGISLPAAVIAYYLINSTGWWTAGITIEPRGAIVAGGFGFAAVLGMIFPSLVMGTGVFIGVSFWLLSRELRTPELAQFR